MKTKKVILLEQITKEVKGGSLTTLSNIIDLLNDKQIVANYIQDSIDYLESIKIDFELKKGMVVRAKRELKGKDCNWNSPSPISIPKGTVFELGSAESNGDLFARLKEGTCTCSPRDRAPYQVMPSTSSHLKTHIILVEGRKSRHPFDFGVALKSDWEIIEVLE